ncbi:Flp family type IVb pilin [Gammaproteobacteria bacterium]|jgi:pilus assembly protein Flp/PilA|nr:Flp family type IVb pilin [Gammaproteobacteria bacterium]
MRRTTMIKQVMKFLRDEEGLTTVEYAVAGGLVAATLVVAFGELGDGVRGVITGLTSAISTAT